MLIKDNETSKKSGIPFQSATSAEEATRTAPSYQRAIKLSKTSKSNKEKSKQ